MNNQSMTATESTAIEPYVLFELAGTTYALRSRDVQQMEMVEHITPVPNATACVEGVVFSRGQVIPAINLRQRFGFEKSAHNLRTRLIVVRIKERSIGLIVDSAREFIKIANDTIHPAPETITELSGKYLEGIATLPGQRLVLILNLDEVLNKIELNMTAVEDI